MTRCARCGSTDLVGGRYFHVVAHVTATLPCGCVAGMAGVACVRRFRRPTRLQEWVRLDQDGGWATEGVEQVGVEDEEPVRTDVFCPDCVAAAAAGDWHVRGDGVEDRFGQSPFVACHGCGAEHLIV